MYVWKCRKCDGLFFSDEQRECPYCQGESIFFCINMRTRRCDACKLEFPGNYAFKTCPICHEYCDYSN